MNKKGSFDSSTEDLPDDADSENWSNLASVLGRKNHITELTFNNDLNFDALNKFYSLRIPMAKKCFGQSWKSDFRVLLYSSQIEPLAVNKFDEISLEHWKKVLNSEFFWIDIFQPTLSELDLFQKIFTIKSATVDIITSGSLNESLENFYNYKFLSLLASKSRDKAIKSIIADRIEICNIFSIILFKGILTFQTDSLFYRKRVLERISKIGPIWNLSPGWIAYAFLDEVVDSLLPILRSCEEEAGNLEDLALNPDKQTLRSFTTCSLNTITKLKQRVFTISKLVCQKNNICQSLTRKVINSKDLKNGMHLYFGDVHDHIMSLSQSCVHLGKTLTTTHSNYCDQLTLRSITTNNATFSHTMLLTYVGSGISILIFVAGFFGVNTSVPYRGSDETSRQEPFYLILTFTIIISLLAGYFSHLYAVKKIKGTRSF